MYMCNRTFLVAEREKKIFEKEENTESKRRVTDEMEKFEKENEGKEAVLVST